MRYLNKALRRIGLIVTWAALFIALVLAGLWIRSYYYDDVAGYHATDGCWFVISFRGKMSAGKMIFKKPWPTNDSKWSFQAFPLRSGQKTAYLVMTDEETWCGFGRWNQPDIIMVSFPHVLSTMLAALLPVGAGVLWWRKRRRLTRWAREGRCRHCGYDLRAHRPGDKCPECGSVIGGAGVDDPPTGECGDVVDAEGESV